MGFWSWLGLAEKRDILSLQSEINLLKEDNKKFYKQNLEMQKQLEEICKQNLDTITNEIVISRKQLELLSQKSDRCIERMESLYVEFQQNSESIGEQINKNIDESIQLMLANHDADNKQYDNLLKTFKFESDNICCKLDEIKNNIIDRLKANSELSVKECNIALKEISKYKGEIELQMHESQKYMEMLQESILNNSDLMKTNESLIREVISTIERIGENTDNMDEFQESLSSLSESVRYLWVIMKAVWIDSVLSDMDSLQ